MNTGAVAMRDAQDGWIDAARRVPSPNCDARPAGTDIDLLVIHAISLPPAQFGGPYVEQLFTNRLDCSAHPYFAGLAGVRVSAHFLITRDGRLYQFVDIFERAWHAGLSSWEGRARCNDFSVGVELEGCDELPFEQAQYTRLLALAEALLEKLPALHRGRVVGHSDIAPLRKTDPGPHFDWVRVRSGLSR